MTVAKRSLLGPLGPLGPLGLLLLVAASQVHAQSIGDRLRRAAGNIGSVVRTLLPISTDKEIEIGRGIASTIAGRFPVSTDTALTAYVNLVGLTVAGEAPRPDIAYRFAVLETPMINAFSAPGGYIFITRGALELCRDESELAGVLAHEVGHVNRRHVIEQIRKSDFMKSVSDQAGITGSKLDQVVGAGSNVLFTGLSRGDELEADSIGIELAAGAGYDPNGLATFVARLESRRGGPAAELFATHPPPAVRLERFRAIEAREHLAGGAVLADRFKRTTGVGGKG